MPRLLLAHGAPASRTAEPLRSMPHSVAAFGPVARILPPPLPILPRRGALPASLRHPAPHQAPAKSHTVHGPGYSRERACACVQTRAGSVRGCEIPLVRTSRRRHVRASRQPRLRGRAPAASAARGARPTSYKSLETWTSSPGSSHWFIATHGGT